MKDENGTITELHCTYIPESRSGHDTSGINVKGTIHWVSVAHAVPAEVRLYDRLFAVENPAVEEKEMESEDDNAFVSLLNPTSLVTMKALVEPNLADRAVGSRVQFMRKGYFCVDADSTPGHLVFNRTVTLKDAWAKETKKG